jgi:hypothetical protein
MGAISANKIENQMQDKAGPTSPHTLRTEARVSIQKSFIWSACASSCASSEGGARASSSTSNAF